MKAPRKRCLVEGCEKVAKGRCEGRCQIHFKEYIAQLDANDDGIGVEQAHRTKFFCAVENCQKQAAGNLKGYCQRHFRELKPEEFKQASAEMDPAIVGKRCSVPDCTKWARGKTGMCRRCVVEPCINYQVCNPY